MMSYLDSIQPIKNIESHIPEFLRFYYLITELIQTFVLLNTAAVLWIYSWPCYFLFILKSRSRHRQM